MEVELQKWLEGTPDCRLPCFGGIVPGLTTWDQAKQILASVGEIVGIHEEHSCLSGECKSLEWHPGGSYKHNSMQLFGVFSSGSNDRINYFRMEGYPPSPILRLDTILTTYGSPAKAFTFVGPRVYGSPYFDLILAYPEHQFIIYFSWFGVWGNGDNTVKGCIQQNSFDLNIDSRDQEWSDGFIKNLVYPPDTIPATMIVPLEKSTGLTMDEFHNTFKTISGDECLTVPVQFSP